MTIIAPTHVTQVVHGVILADDLIPAVDDGRVHVVRIRERSSAVADDVRVPEVGICGQPDQNRSALNLFIAPPVLYM